MIIRLLPILVGISLASAVQAVEASAQPAARNAADTIGLDISLSERPLFTMPVIVRNTNAAGGVNASRTLIFGIGGHATYGAEAGHVGTLDWNYREYELPPPPPADVFDARWLVPTTNGILRNIQPDNGVGYSIPWAARFNAGDILGETGRPITLTWSLNDARECPTGLTLTDQHADMATGTGLLLVNMKTGTNLAGSGIMVQKLAGDSVRVSIYLTSLAGFNIYRTGGDGVPSRPEYDLLSPQIQAWPVPSTGKTSLKYYIPAAADIAIEIFDAKGARVRTLFIGRRQSGYGTAHWDGCNEKGIAVPTGNYTCRFVVDETVLSCQMIVIR